MKKPSANDLSARVLAKKALLFPKNIKFVTCSAWLAEVARSSSLLKNHFVTNIPNPISPVFTAGPIGLQVRSEPATFRLLFSAMKVEETRKGFAFLREALHLLKTQHPSLTIQLVVLGNTDPVSMASLPYPTETPGMIRDQALLIRYLAEADLFVIPSLEDNLPNTVMESLACGTPVVGFDTGGIPEMVDDGINGFIAAQGDSQGLADGIHKLVSDRDLLQKMRIAAREKALRCYSLAVVAKQYLNVYKK